MLTELNSDTPLVGNQNDFSPDDVYQMLYFYAAFNIEHLSDYVVNQDSVKVHLERRLERRPYLFMLWKRNSPKTCFLIDWSTAALPFMSQRFS